ncbi:MAG: hypothetical protein AAFQ51_14245 [Pseudomonadota bacterium]
MRTALATLISAGLVTAGAAFAQTDTLGTTPEAPTLESTEPTVGDAPAGEAPLVELAATDVTEEMLVGAETVSSDGINIGEVTAMSADDQGVPMNIAVDTSRFFGLVGDTKLVPVEMTTIRADTETGALQVTVNLTAAEVDSLPAFSG